MTAEAILTLSPAAFRRLTAAHLDAAPGIGLERLPARHAIRITASGDAALAAAASAALALYDRIGDKNAVIDGLRITGSHARRVAGHPSAQAPIARPGGAVRPQVLMGEVAAPPPDPDAQRDAFRAFMMRNRLRPTQWARDAGVPSGAILGFLSGRARGLDGPVAEKLARVARVQVADMFRPAAR
jgi:hypothetical protein